MKKYLEEHGQEIVEEDKKREQQILAEQKINLIDGLGKFFGGILGFGRPKEEPEIESATAKSKVEIESATSKSEVEEKK